MPVAFADLARAYISENDRAKALEITSAGQQQFPDSFEIRQVMDMMNRIKNLVRSPPIVAWSCLSLARSSFSEAG